MIYFDRLCLAKCYLPKTGHEEVWVVARFLAAAQITGMHAELTRRKPVLWRGAHPVPPLLSIAQKIQTLICPVAASASEWRSAHSLTLAATEERDHPASHEAGHYGPLAGARGTEESSVQRTLVSGAFFNAAAGAVRERAFTIDDGLSLGEAKLPGFNVECRARFFPRRGPTWRDIQGPAQGVKLC